MDNVIANIKGTGSFCFCFFSGHFELFSNQRKKQFTFRYQCARIQKQMSQFWSVLTNFGSIMGQTGSIFDFFHLLVCQI